MLFRKKKPAAGKEAGQGHGYNLIRQEENERYLRELLSRRRPPEVQTRLERVLRHEKDTLKRIAIVERVDHDGIASLGLYEARIRVLEEKQRNAAAWRYERPGQPVGFPFPHAMPRPGHTVERPRFARFFLRERSAITAFGRQHRLLAPRFFGTRHELTDDFLQYWDVELKVLLHFVEEPLTLLVEEGWTRLSVAQYNLAVVMRDMVRYFRDNELLVFEHRVSPEFMARLEPFLRAWLQLTLRTEYKELLLDAVHGFLRDIRTFAPVLRKVTAAVERLLEHGKPGPSPGNCLLALWMAAHRRRVHETDLAVYLGILPVDESAFQCPKRIQERIAQFVTARRAELGEIERTLAFFAEMQIADPEDMEGAVLPDLAGLYLGRRGAVGEDGLSPATAARRQLEYDLVSFTEKTLSTFLYQAWPLLSAGVRAAGGGRELAVFESAFFAREHDALAGALERLRATRGAHDRLTLTVGFYGEYVDKRQPEAYSATERQLADGLLAVAAGAQALAMKLGQQLAQDRHLAVVSAQDEPESKLRSVTVDAVIPHASELVEFPEYYRGLSLRDALQLVLRQAVGLAFVLRDPVLHGFVRKRVAMEDREAELRRLIKRMA